MKALILDDVPLMRKVILSKLMKLGVENVIETGDPRKAIMEFNNDAGIKLVISDYRMPTMNGGEFFAKIYKIPNSKNIKSILISGIEDLQYVKTGENLPVDYYLSKTDLMEKLEGIVKEARDFIPESQNDLVISLGEFNELISKETPKLSSEKNTLVLEFNEKKISIKLPEQLSLLKKES